MFFKILLALVFLELASAAVTYDKVNLTFVYETRCPYSLQFMRKFYPGYNTLSDYINLELIIRTWPYDNGTLHCQHGENECFISKAQACSYDRPGVTDAIRVAFLQCSEEPAQQGKDAVDSDIEACVNSVLANIVAYDTVKTCMAGEESFTLLKVHYDKETNYGVNSVPWLALFGKFDANTETELRSDFVGTICKLLSNPPDVCNE